MEEGWRWREGWDGMRRETEESGDGEGRRGERGKRKGIKIKQNVKDSRALACLF